MPTITKAWKVVSRTNKKLFSAAFALKAAFTLKDDIKAGLCLRYIRGTWTKPRIKGSRIFVFSDPVSARRWAGTHKKYAVWECMAEDAVPVDGCSVSDPVGFWQCFNGETPMRVFRMTPPGTLGATAVMITRRCKCPARIP